MSESMAIFNFFQDYKSEIRRNEKYGYIFINRNRNYQNISPYD